jgi:ribonuclease P protein component
VQPNPQQSNSPAVGSGLGKARSRERAVDTSTQKGARFAKAARLLKHAEFDRVYRQGRRHFSPHMTIFYLRRESDAAQPRFRIGLTVGRVLGGAVERNRIKRRLREAVRLNLAQFDWRTLPAHTDVVINPRKAVLTLAFDALVNEVGEALRAIAAVRRSSGARS